MAAREKGELKKKKKKKKLYTKVVNFLTVMQNGLWNFFIIFFLTSMLANSARKGFAMLE